jgi:hypothetical protein
MELSITNSGTISRKGNKWLNENQHITNLDDAIDEQIEQDEKDAISEAQDDEQGVSTSEGEKAAGNASGEAKMKKGRDAIMQDVNQSTENFNTTRATTPNLSRTDEIYKELFGLMKEPVDEKRMDNTRRVAKIQSLTNALGQIAQIGGAFGGARVPRMEVKNAAGEELKRLTDYYRDQEAQARAQAIQAALQQVGREDQMDFQRLEREAGENFRTKESKEYRDFQGDQAEKNREHQYDFHLFTRPGFKQQARTINGIRMDGEIETKTGKWTAYPYQAVQHDGEMTRSGRRVKKDDYGVIYAKDSNVPLFSIRNEGEAMNLINQVLAKADRDESGVLVDPALMAIERNLQEGEGSLNKYQILSAIDKHWEKSKPQMQPGKYGWPVHEYISNNFNPRERAMYENYIQNNINNISEGKIESWLKNYDPEITPAIAKSMAREQMQVIKEFDGIGISGKMNQESTPEGLQAGVEKEIVSYNQNQSMMRRHAIAYEKIRSNPKYKDNPKAQRTLLMSLLMQDGLSHPSAETLAEYYIESFID